MNDMDMDMDMERVEGKQKNKGPIPTLDGRNSNKNFISLTPHTSLYRDRECAAHLIEEPRGRTHKYISTHHATGKFSQDHL